MNPEAAIRAMYAEYMKDECCDYMVINGLIESAYASLSHRDLAQQAPRDRGFWAANSYGEIVRVQFMGEATDNVPIAMFGSLDADDCYTGHPLIWASEITDWDDNRDALAARVSATPGEPAWQRINALFARHGVTPPPTRLRDELVTHLLAYDREECAARVAWSGDLTKSAAPTPNCPTPSTTTPSAREGWRGLRGIDWAALLLIAFTVIGVWGALLGRAAQMTEGSGMKDEGSLSQSVAEGPRSPRASVAEPSAVKWTLEQPDKWPFDLIVRDEDGAEVVTIRRWAHATCQKTLEDCREAYGFTYGEKAEIVTRLARQEARCRLIAAAPELYAALKPLAALHGKISPKAKDDACWCGQDGAVIRYRDIRAAHAILTKITRSAALDELFAADGLLYRDREGEG